ncbi:L-lactate dehydrogenase [Proteiniclasticum sp. SCR006]|uniref:L-lactate dehydrogenase n=1 Tax=Proteiniclasticum aestuarii TaxID=2817862 RepID=A0A939H9K9_9CLOT|nr:L-lactate dehydrogenase [Proteiniclasticum aestuarii]MBO1263902.1 L-lactate dehydrogenase [Proteiniclasticum aestuarii]
MKLKNVKISIIGAGFVGATTTYALMLGGLCEELVLVDVNKDKAIGEAMDISHGAAFVKPVKVMSGDYEDTKGSDIVIITAGAAQKPGETRLDLVNKNIGIYRQIIPEIVKYSPDSILLVVSNPVDILAYVAYKLSGFPRERVIGSGTVLDTSRFRTLLAEYLDVDARSIHGYIIGEHGDSEIAAWSLTNIAGVNLKEYVSITEKGKGDLSFMEYIPLSVKNAAYEMINTKGYTNYAVALAVRRICEAITGDEKAILTVSSLLDGEYGLKDLYIGIPSIVGKEGIKKVIEVPLKEKEREDFIASAETMKKIIEGSSL